MQFCEKKTLLSKGSPLLKKNKHLSEISTPQTRAGQEIT